jgi:hypothetical protein
MTGIYKVIKKLEDKEKFKVSKDKIKAELDSRIASQQASV